MRDEQSAQITQTVYIPVTAKTIGAALALIITALGSFPLANWLSPSVRSDPFTGSEGSELSVEIGSLKEDYLGWKEEHQIWVRLAAVNFARLEDNDKYCQDSIRSMNIDLDNHTEKFDVLNHKVTSHQTKMIEINRRQDQFDEYFIYRN